MAPSERQPLTHPHAIALHAYALSLPEAWEDFPWGDRVAKVRKKIFAFVGDIDGGFGVTAKLPESAHIALSFPWAEPTGYNLGKSGWVSMRFALDATDVPLAFLEQCIAESYRAVAPKKLAALLAAPHG